jgi:hypothetical protein
MERVTVRIVFDSGIAGMVSSGRGIEIVVVGVISLVY